MTQGSEAYSASDACPCAGAFSNWEGMAPAAKIAFQDLGSGSSGTLSVPYDLFSDYFPYNYQWCCPAPAHSGIHRILDDSPFTQCNLQLINAGAWAVVLLSSLYEIRGSIPSEWGVTNFGPWTPPHRRPSAPAKMWSFVPERMPAARILSEQPRPVIFLRSLTRVCLLHALVRGARVHSDSWGTADATYDSLAADLDRFAWAYQDFLPVVAAGNFGYREQDSTLTSPAVAKNCVAVGAWILHILELALVEHRHGLILDPLSDRLLCKCDIFGACAGAGLTASYNDGYESEVVTTDASMFALNITGGQPGSRADGTSLIKACTSLSPTLLPTTDVCIAVVSIAVVSLRSQASGSLPRLDTGQLWMDEAQEGDQDLAASKFSCLPAKQCRLQSARAEGTIAAASRGSSIACAHHGKSGGGRVTNDADAQVMQASFGPSLGAMVGSGARLQLLAANPQDACSALVWRGMFRDAVVLAQRGNCTFATKVAAGTCSPAQLILSVGRPLLPGPVILT